VLCDHGKDEVLGWYNDKGIEPPTRTQEDPIMDVLVRYRRAMRNVLGRKGVPTNPGATDDEVLLLFEEHFDGQG